MIRHRNGTACLFALLALFAAGNAGATDYYVATSGSDAASGLAPGTAWATLQHAADTVGPGDTVHVADGDYTGFDVRIVAIALAPVAFVAEGPAVQIVADNAVTPDGINIENAAYVTVDGFVVSGRTRTGIRTAVSDHVTIRNCRCGNNGRWGILTGFVDDVLIEDNETYGSIDEHGIYVSNSGDRPVIRGNHSHDNHANGIHMNGDVSLGGDGTISNALVENNVIHGNGVGGGSGINMDGVVDSVVRNNLLYDNHASGISLYRIDGATGSTGNLVVNNTIVNASNGRWCVNINNGSTGNTLRNNILYNLHSFRGVILLDSSSTSGFSSDHNSLMDRMSADAGSTILDLAGWQALGYDPNSFVATPADHFANPASDFHLLPTSPAIDAGTATGAPGQDLEGGARPVGAGYDLGAYESQLPDCGDGDGDPGEICGEPGLPACGDPCTTCLGCVCAPAEPVCGDALVCGAEQCEDDGDCSGGTICDGCACVNPPVCTSGIVLERPRLKARATPYSLRLKAELVIPRPWNAPEGGIRVVLDSTTGTGGFDAILPGGSAWKANASATSWSYRDDTASVAGITRAVIKDRSSAEDGRVRVLVKAKAASGPVLPDTAAVRTSVVLGDSDECGAIEWNGPDEAPPACEGGAAQLSCR